MNETEFSRTTVPAMYETEISAELSFLDLTVGDNELEGELIPKKKEYKEIFVRSFPEAVLNVLNDINPGLSSEKVGDRNMCLVDLDGTLMEDNRVKLPFISTFIKPRIPEENILALERLKDRLEGSVVICSNRSSNGNNIFNTLMVVNELNRGLKSRDIQIPVFLSLSKQVPGMNKEDVSQIYLSVDGKEVFDNENVNQHRGLREPLAELVVQYIGKRLSECDSKYSTGFTLYSIEDLSIVSPNRKTFLNYLAGRVKKEYENDVNIINYVIKR